jgi:predicted ABC-type ATPase
MFAGPNGSGKSVLIQQLNEPDYQFELGPIINADLIAKELDQSGCIDLTYYHLKNLSSEAFQNSCSSIPELKERLRLFQTPPNIYIKQQKLYCDPQQMDSYTAALIADFLRYQCVEKGISFSFETVMSHDGKIDFLEYAHQHGFITYLYFIATEDELINVQRVKNRTLKGGHDVPEDKIISRYYRSLGYLVQAVKTAQRAYILDNSEQDNFVIAEKNYDGDLIFKVDEVPGWFNKYVMDKLEG